MKSEKMGEANRTSKRVIIAGGGTGGHLFPGLAVAAELRTRLDAEILFVGTRRGIEARTLPARGENVVFLEVTPLKGRGPSDLLRSVGRLPRAAFEARRVIRDFGADLVIGVGGYASGPVLAAATSLGVPTAILEQNAHLGLTNRLVAPVVGRGYLTFDETASSFGPRARVLGNPVRPEVTRAARAAAMDPEGFESRAACVLVLGGSQGAQALNEALPPMLARVAGDYRIVHQCGRGRHAEVQARYEQLGVDAEVVEFIDDMAAAYASAVLVVGRAGATTLAEVCAIGRASVLVPYPSAADDHQTHNARSLERDGAAVCVPQSEMQESLLSSLQLVLSDEAKRQAMARAARRRGRPDAAAAIVDDVCDWLRWEMPNGAKGLEALGSDVDNADDEPPEEDPFPKKGRLRGFGSYQPTLVRRRSTPPPAPRRALVFASAHGWE